MLGEIIHKPIWTCLNRGEKNMYQDGTGTIHKRSGGGEFISPILNINKSPAMPIYCLLYTSPSPRDATLSRMPSSA